jgi:hypothetical protein
MGEEKVQTNKFATEANKLLAGKAIPRDLAEALFKATLDHITEERTKDRLLQTWLYTEINFCKRQYWYFCKDGVYGSLYSPAALMLLEPDGEGSFKTKGLPFANYVKATEVTLPYLITKIEVGGTVIEYTDAWLKKLTQRDYKLLKVHVDKMIAEAGGAIMEGKKNG